MYKEHYIFELPSDNTVIWRYMDLWKFEDLLKTNELYMASIKKMGDSHESEVPKNIRKRFIEFTRQNEGEEHAEGMRKVLEPSERLKKETYISSWNMKEEESFALWKIYTEDSNAVAIKTTVGKLKESVNGDSRVQQIGAIKYHDGIKYSFRGNLYDPVMYKWNYYDFENELRVVTSEYAKDYDALKTHPEGIRTKMDLDLLIDQIYLAPNATEDQFKNLDNILKSSGLNKKMYQSGIKDKWSN